MFRKSWSILIVIKNIQIARTVPHFFDKYLLNGTMKRQQKGQELDFRSRDRKKFLTLLDLSATLIECGRRAQDPISPMRREG